MSEEGQGLERGISTRLEDLENPIKAKRIWIYVGDEHLKVLNLGEWHEQNDGLRR